MSIDPIMLVGAGGHAKVVFDALQSRYPSVSIRVYDDNLALSGKEFLGVRVCAPVAWRTAGCTSFHVAIGQNPIRRRLQLAGVEAGLEPATVIHPGANISQHSWIGRGIFIAAGAVLAPKAEVGDGAIINHGAIVDHDCYVGAFTHIAPGVALGGGVQVGGGVLIGAGAVVLPGCHIGEDAVVGAGAVVTKDVAAAATVAGVPARVFSKS